MIVTEQYPKGLGQTVPELAEHLPAGVEPIEKTAFSAAEADGFDLGGREQAIVCGIETHVCVNQTVLDLLDRGIEVHVVADAVGSRTEANRELGLNKAERAGAWLTSVETALFELLGRAGGDRSSPFRGSSWSSRRERRRLRPARGRLAPRRRALRGRRRERSPARSSSTRR